MLPWVSITALASLGAVKTTLGSKVPPLETLLPDIEKKIFGIFISDDGKGHFSSKLKRKALVFSSKNRVIMVIIFWEISA